MLTSIVVKFTFDSARSGSFSSVRKYSPNGTSSCVLPVRAMFLAIIEKGEISTIFCFQHQNNSTSSPGLLG